MSEQHDGSNVEGRRSVPVTEEIGWVIATLSVLAGVAAVVLEQVACLALPALAMLIVALVARRFILPERDRKGWQLVMVSAWLNVGLLVLGLAMTIFGGHKGREIPNRVACAANLTGIMKAMVAYADSNSGQMPVVGFAPYGVVANEAKGDLVSGSDESAVVRRYYSGPPPQAGSVQACMWIVVLNGMAGPKEFVCRGDPFAGTAAAVKGFEGTYDNFQNGKQLSYSMAYPWAADGKVGAWWGNTMDSTLPLLADMTPRQGTGKPARNLTPGAATRDNRAWNSGNHEGDGENVAFADGHAEFVRRPDCGEENDNIYTMSGVPSTGPGQFGGVAAGAGARVLKAEKAPFDVVMLPVRDETTGGM